MGSAFEGAFAAAGVGQLESQFGESVEYHSRLGWTRTITGRRIGKQTGRLSDEQYHALRTDRVAFLFNVVRDGAELDANDDAVFSPHEGDTLVYQGRTWDFEEIVSETDTTIGVAFASGRVRRSGETSGQAL